jgi:hypothetical protein
MCHDCCALFCFHIGSSRSRKRSKIRLVRQVEGFNALDIKGKHLIDCEQPYPSTNDETHFFHFAIWQILTRWRSVIESNGKNSGKNSIQQTSHVLRLVCCMVCHQLGLETGVSYYRPYPWVQAARQATSCLTTRGTSCCSTASSNGVKCRARITHSGRWAPGLLEQ